MKNIFCFIVLLLLFTSCEERTEKMENSRGIPGPEKVKALAPDVDEQERELKSRGYQTRRRKTLDRTFLMQEYYIVFLRKSGDIDKDSVNISNLREHHQAYLDELVLEGKATIAGSVAGKSNISEIVIFNTPTQTEADSLIKRSPLVQAGLMDVEVQPWWVSPKPNF